MVTYNLSSLIIEILIIHIQGTCNRNSHDNIYTTINYYGNRNNGNYDQRGYQGNGNRIITLCLINL